MRIASQFDPPVSAVGPAVQRALEEDLLPLGDLTAALVPLSVAASAEVRARTEGVVAGTAVADEVFRSVDARHSVMWRVEDGRVVSAGETLAVVEGPLRSILTAERSALNFLTHLSGVATLTREFVQRAPGATRIRDTRKTIPGLRALEKAAVRAGGGVNHRGSLSEAILIKDNHLALAGVRELVAAARERWPDRRVQVECDTAKQALDAVMSGADSLLLDNMEPALVREVVERVAGRVPVEASGGITLDNVAAYAATGVDFIAIGALTHSAPALDIGLDFTTDAPLAEGHRTSRASDWSCR